jgi:hypothetical protein
MKQLLSLILLFIGVVSYAQTVRESDSLLAENRRNTNRLIIEKYCPDPYIYHPDTVAINLYQQKADLHLNGELYKGYVYPSNQKLMLDPAGTRGTGIFYGSAKANMYNPYGSTSVPSALINGTVNYLLKGKHK